MSKTERSILTVCVLMTLWIIIQFVMMRREWNNWHKQYGNTCSSVDFDFQSAGDSVMVSVPCKIDRIVMP